MLTHHFCVFAQLCLRPMRTALKYTWITLENKLSIKMNQSFGVSSMQIWGLVLNATQCLTCTGIPGGPVTVGGFVVAGHNCTSLLNCCFWILLRGSVNSDVGICSTHSHWGLNLNCWVPEEPVLFDMNHGGFWRLLQAEIQKATLPPFTVIITVLWTLCLMCHGVMPWSGSNLSSSTRCWVSVLGSGLLAL